MDRSAKGYYVRDMRVIVTAGPTREYIDSVRFISNASSGRMGYACASAAAAAGHTVTLITGPVSLHPPKGCRVVDIVSVGDLKAALAKCFPSCDALVMTAAVGDFAVARRRRRKIPRRGGPVTLRLTPTEDILAGVARRKRPGQTIIGFAVEDSRNLAKARREMLAKHCDYLVLNGPAAMGAKVSEACILSRQGTCPERSRGLALPWRRRSKQALARVLVRLLSPRSSRRGPQDA